MNKQRRKQIDQIITRIEALQGLIEEVNSDIETIKDEEQEALENLPESLQEGEKGQTMQSAIDSLEEAYGELEGLDFDNIVTILNTAQE